MKKVVIVGIVAALVLCIAVQSVSAVPTSARVRGYITDAGENPIEGALVEWKNNATDDFLTSASTTSTGYYSMTWTFAGTIESLIIASKAGYIQNSTVINIEASFMPDWTEVNLMLQEEEALPEVVINEFVSDNDTEWVELYNNGSSSVDLTDWTLEDEIGTSKSLSSLGTIGVDGYKVFTYEGTWLNNGGDIIWLNSTTENVDRVGYGTFGGAPAPDAGNSTGRDPNGVDTDNDAADFIEFGTPTPGAANEAPAEVDTTAPTTNVTTPEMTEEPSPIPPGHELNWTNEDVNISFRRTDNVGGIGVDYTNYSKTSETGPWTTVNATTAIGTDADNVSAITDETFNVTVSDEGITKIYYYSVDKNETPKNVEDTKNLTVKIDTTLPDIISVELNKTSVNASEPILVSVNVIDPQNGGVASGIAKVTATAYATATPVELTQDGNWWNGTITAAVASGLHNVTVIAYDNASNTATNDTVQYEVLVIAEITAFEIETPTADLGQNFVARINVTTTENATAGWYVVVVSGVNETTGEGLAGIGTVRMDKNDFVENMPVLVHIPPVTTLGDYELYAGLYRLEDYPSKLESILDHEGPETVTVT